MCRNTNLVFSPYDYNGHNKVKCAFMGVYFDKDEKGFDENNRGVKSVKFSSCEAATRYEHDSQSTVDLGLTKGEYYKTDDGHWGEYDSEKDESSHNISPANRQYIDPRIAK